MTRKSRYLFFDQEHWNVTVGMSMKAMVRINFASNYFPLGGFEPFGASYFVKGIFKVNSYFEVKARLQATMAIFAGATAEISIHHPRHWLIPPRAIYDTSYPALQ